MYPSASAYKLKRLKRRCTLRATPPRHYTSPLYEQSMYIIGENTRVQQCLTLPKLREVIWMEQAKKQIHGE